MTLREKLKALESKRQSVAARIRELAKAEETRDLTEDELKEVEKLSAESEQLKSDIDSAKRRTSAYEDASRVQDDEGRQRRKTRPDSPGSVEVGEPEFVKDPKKGFKSTREFCETVVAATVDRKEDERLNYLSASRIEATAGSDEQSGFADPYGGFFVPEGLAPGVLQIDPEPDPMAGRTTMVPMQSPKVSFNARVDKDHSTSVTGGLTVTRRPESVDATASRQKYEQVKLIAESLFGLAFATEEILTDSPASFAAMLAAGFSDQFTSHLINERLNGTGAGEYEGIRNSGAMITVAKETSQPADTIVIENLIKMRARCWRYGSAVWMCNHDCIPQLFGLNIGITDSPKFVQSLREDVPDLLLGRPVIFTEYNETVGDAGDIVLANWSQYLEGVYQGLQSGESIHVRYIQHERTFKFWVRNAGGSWWKTALTPKKGANTLSPYVQLAARA